MKVIHVSKTYKNKNTKVEALTDVSLSIEESGMIFILGPSGCGKTTLLHILSNMDTAYQGKVVCNGTVETIAQEISLMESLSVLDNLLLVKQDTDVIDELLARFQMKDYRNTKVKKLSIGQKKRVQIMRSLLVEATYYLCDEPTAALDYENISIVMQALTELSKDKAVIIVSHDIGLVDTYATRCIQMGKGIIQSDTKIVDGKPLVETKIITKKRKSSILHWSLKRMLSRPIEILLQGCLIGVFIISMFISTSLFTSLQASSKHKDNWTYSKNVIITQPKIRIQDSKEANASGLYQEYDIYDKQTIRLARDNVPEVIGYRYGWALQEYSLDGAFAPGLNIDALKKVVDEEERRMEETGQAPCHQYVEFKDILARVNVAYPNGDFPKHIILCTDFRSYEGFNKIENGYDIPLNYQVSIGKKGTSVNPYQIFSRYTMPLQAGNMPINDNEIVVSSTMALEMKKELGVETNEELVGKSTSLYITEKNDQPIPVVISGITYEGSVYENQIYFREGAWDKKIETLYHMTPDRLKYLYVYFLSDATYDEQEVATKINQVVESQDSTFTSYSDSIFMQNTKVQYHNPIYFTIFAIIVCIALLLFYSIMHYIVYKREDKEIMVLKRYGYPTLWMRYLPTVILLFINGCLQISMLSFICEKVNVIANTAGFASIIVYDGWQYLFVFICSSLLLLMIGGGMYGYRIKKHK